MNATEEPSVEQLLDRYTRGITTQRSRIKGYERDIKRYERRSEKIEVPASLVPMYERSIGHARATIEDLEGKIAELEPAELVRPKQRYLGLISKMLPVLPEKATMGRQSLVNEPGSGRLHTQAYKMIAVSAVIIAVAWFVANWSFAGVYPMLSTALSNAEVGFPFTSVLGGLLGLTWAYWYGSIWKYQGAHYQGRFMFLTQMLFTGSENWTAGKRTRAHLGLTLFYLWPAFIMFPIIAVVAFIASIQLMSIYRREYETTGSAVKSAQATAVVYKVYEYGAFIVTMVVLLVMVFIP